MELTRPYAARALAGGLTVLALPLIVTACRSGSAQELGTADRDPVAVRVANVKHRMVARPIVAPGTFGPKDETRLSFKIGGVVETIAVEAGRSVRAGDLLAALDLREIDSALRKAKSAADKAERDLERARRLYADSVFTLSQLQDAETAAEVARADLEAAEFNRRYAVIVAPADGAILSRTADRGETVSPGAEIFVLGSRARGAVMRVGLPDRDVVRVRLGDRSIARFDATGDRTYHGLVSEIAATATPGTGTYAVEVTLSDAGPLVAGMIGSVEIVPSTGAPTTVVPVEAMLEADGTQATVFALSSADGRAQRRTVNVAFLDGDVVAVTSGLEGVDSVVTDGAAWLSDGDEVRVIR